MNRGIYTIATGMQAVQQTMDVVANNLANSSTTGFKQDNLLFADALERELFANGGAGPSIGTLGSGPSVKFESSDFALGSMTVTNNPLDMLVDGQGMFGVRTPRGTMYTRDGAFVVKEENGVSILSTKQGYPVLDPSGNEIRMPRGAFKVAPDGTITDLTTQRAMQRIGLFMGDFRKNGENLFGLDRGQATPVTDETVKIRQGSIENSNVSAIAMMLEMIKLNRVFEISQKLASAEDETTGQLVQTM